MTTDRQTPAQLIGDISQTTFDSIVAKSDPTWSTILHTPFLQSHKLSQTTGCALFIKYENLQYTGAFKERGALAKLVSLSAAQRAAGVIAASAGNHAQGVARIAQHLGITATIFMPKHTPVVKIQQTEALGASVVLEGDDFESANALAMQMCAQEGAVFVHPFDDPYIITGQGTIAAEMLAAQPDLDCLVIPIGGGGLIAGCAAVAKSINPAIKIIGVQTALYPSMYNAVKGTSHDIGGMTLAEGIAVRQPGARTQPIIEALVDDIVIVDERALERALSLYLNTQKVLAEGSGAAGLAAILSYPDMFKGTKTGTIICGGNIDTRLVSSILLRDLARKGRLARLRIELRDVPGQLTKVAAIIADAGGNVIDVSYHRIFNDLPAKATYLDISVEAYHHTHLETIIADLCAAGLPAELANY